MHLRTSLFILVTTTYRCTLFISNMLGPLIRSTPGLTIIGLPIPTIPATLLSQRRRANLTEVTPIHLLLTVTLPLDRLLSIPFILPSTVTTWAHITYQARTIIKLLLLQLPLTMQLCAMVPMGLIILESQTLPPVILPAVILTHREFITRELGRIPILLTDGSISKFLLPKKKYISEILLDSSVEDWIRMLT